MEEVLQYNNFLKILSFSTITSHMKKNANMPVVLVTTLMMAVTPICRAEPAASAKGDPHAGISCTLCHAGAAARAAVATVADGPDPRSRTCRGCHRDVGARGGSAASLGFHGNPKADCAGCHSFHEAGRLKSTVGDVRLPASRQRAVPGHCAGCHADGARLSEMSGAHRTAAALYHQGGADLAAQSPSEGCLNCHSASHANDWQNRPLEGRLVFSEHATHPLGMVVVAGSGQDERRIRERIDPRLRLFDGRLECQTCHSLASTKPYLLVEFPTQGDLCLGCHQLRNARPERAQELMATMMQH